jgi:hypothetical protein
MDEDSGFAARTNIGVSGGGTSALSGPCVIAFPEVL